MIVRLRVMGSIMTAVLLLAWAFVSGASGQSSDQNLPTPVTAGEITGEVRPRDIGDARLTTYFYTFEAGQGDLFINVATRNFTGDIDVFAASGLRPLAKIVMYADLGESETGRVLYFRKPEKLLLRVHGRTPGDDPASFRIKFAGSFIASKETEPAADPELPKTASREETGIRVNSVGTIIEVVPKKSTTSKPPAGEERDAMVAEKAAAERPEPIENKEEPADQENAAPKVAVVVTDPSESKPSANRTAARNREGTTRGDAPKRTRGTTSRVVRSSRDVEPAPDPMASIRLVVLFKDGTKIERPMSEVLRFTVDKGTLTVIAKNGTIGRYSILDVSKVTIE